MSNPVSGLAGWVTGVVESLGYIGIATLVALENLIPPIPSEIILPLAGFLVGQGRFSFPFVLIAATIGSVTGALVLYGLGRFLGEHHLRAYVKKYGRFILLNEDGYDAARDRFSAHGNTVVLFGRFIPGVRSLISVPAGVVAMPIGQFVAYTTIGSAIWNAGLVGLGWILGHEWTRIERYATYLEYLVLAVLVIAAGWFLWRKRDRIPV